jgi:membrane protease YdiL (CAAX protease family)
VAVEPLVLLVVHVSVSWLVYLYLLPRSPWARAHYDDINTALFLYLPLVPLFAMRGELEAGVATYGVQPGGIPRGLAVAAATGAVVAPLFALGMWILSQHGPSWFRPSFEPHVPKSIGAVAFFQLVQVALPEEFFFRGYAQGRLNQVFTGRVRILGAEVGWGLVWANVLFAIAHPLLSGPHVLASWWRLETFIPGLLFGWLRERGGGVLAPMLVHWGSNLLLFALVKGG